MTKVIANFFQSQWQKLSMWHVLLVPLSWLFKLIAGVRRWSYQCGIFKSYSVGKPVIIVGNISVGGTGKTPLVIWLAKQFKQAGFAPGIVSRGYGGEVQGEVTALSAPFIVGDEPVLIAQRSQCPVWVGKNRVSAVQALLDAHPECDVILSDDGLQHYRLERDIEIAIVDGMRGFGNGYLLPAGPLRESISRLDAVDFIVQNGGILPNVRHTNAYKMALEGAVFFQLSNPAITATVANFEGKRILAVAGIGYPERFFKQLASMGLQFNHQAFPDHHPFQLADFQHNDAEIVLMTEKDAVKCSQFSQPHWWYLAVEATLEGAFFENLLKQLGK